MFSVATCLLFDRDGKLLIYLRDNNPQISFPNHWDLFGGLLEEGETPEQALVREVKEELGITLSEFYFWKEYESQAEEKPNKKYVFYARTNSRTDELKLLDVGQQLKGIYLHELSDYQFANIIGKIVEDFKKAAIDF